MNALRAFLCLVLFITAAPPARAAEPTSGRKPNVLLVLLDDVGYGDFSCHGNPVMKTPQIDKLHRENIRLTDFHVCPMCTPTRGQLLTGRDALVNGAMNVAMGRTFLRRDFPTAADIFAAQGYRTGHFGKWHLGDNYPYRPHDRGFQETIYSKSYGMASAAHYWNSTCFDDYYFHNGVAQKFAGYNTDLFFDAAMQFMKARNDQKQPFFVYLPLTAAHGPQWVAARYRAPYRDQQPRVADYFGMLANVDENLGRLDTFLQKERLKENTIVVLLSDNGIARGLPVFNAGMRGHKTQLYEGGHRVACFLRWPAGKLRPAGDVGGLTQCQDLLPTLIDLCGLKKADAAFDGTSLAAVLRGDKPVMPDRTLVVQYSRMDAPRPRKGDACVLWRRWRLVADQELYDLRTDPAQKVNVLDKHPAVVERMRSHYDKWWAKVERGVNEFQPIHVGSDAENPSVLSSADWQDVMVAESDQVRKGESPNGPWHIQVEKAGDYEISLRRWPAEADLAIAAAAPAFQGPENSQYRAGRALPIAKARLRVGSIDESRPVNATDKAVTFQVKLRAGRTLLQTWFSDRDDKELCGAYYVYVRRR
ncbi:MAG TPA: arylsulfatase [Gemmataceae bacterium]|jgi:arylsulfatase